MPSDAQYRLSLLPTPNLLITTCDHYFRPCVENSWGYHRQDSQKPQIILYV